MQETVKDLSEIYPPRWQDDNSMAVLFTGFRPRELNPENYDSKMKFWQNLLETYCEYKGEPNFCIAELLQNFKRKQSRPECLESVVQDLLQNRKLRLLHEYEYDPLNSWSGWAINCAVKRPLHWSLAKLKSVVGWAETDACTQIQYVHLMVTKKFCEALMLQVLEPNRGKVLTYNEFKSLSSAVVARITERSLRLCLHTLHCQQEICMEKLFQDTEDETLVIKIPAANKKDVNLIDVDRLRVLWKIKDLKLQEQVKQIQKEADNVRINMAKNNREIAKVHLRKKKTLEKQFEKLSSVLHNIETLINSVEEAQSHGVILDAYKSGSKALKEAVNSSGLNIENVDEIMTEMRETLHDQHEIEESIANVDLDVSNVTTAQLEKELNELANEKPTENVPPLKVEAKTPQFEVDDAELLAMLEELEVADDSIASNITITELKPALTKT